MNGDKFNPNQYVISLKGKAYLPALPRIQWMRSEHPDWGIKTSVEQFHKDEGFILIKAEIVDEKGNVIAQAFKSQRKIQFADYIEKAETGAISRAVAFAGYGTLMAADVEEEGVKDEKKWNINTYGTEKPH